jgi:hypothetical protein
MMAAINFSLPDDVKEAFNGACQGQINVLLLCAKSPRVKSLSSDTEACAGVLSPSLNNCHPFSPKVLQSAREELCNS